MSARIWCAACGVDVRDDGCACERETRLARVVREAARESVSGSPRDIARALRAAARRAEVEA